MKLHHYGFATKSIDKSLKEFEKIGYTATSERIIDPIQGVELLFIGNDTSHLIELVSPLDKNDSPVTKILQKNGASLYHICYEVEDLDVTIEDFKKKKFLLVLAPTPAVAFNNRRISFMYNTHLGLIEFLEK
ncbi:lactoylglutathione lyase [Riemerella anatipestifer]|uniref:VOC family protein n=1 Tax=Riemerella anatipestifer TaxID=34085 RepID=UPI002363A82D|nr:VOC family protein [Riemerella anatipestifer]MDD1552701.1 lactoylglutathione lyase [Riemerella anatipestifer]